MLVFRASENEEDVNVCICRFKNVISYLGGGARGNYVNNNDPRESRTIWLESNVN